MEIANTAGDPTGIAAINVNAAAVANGLTIIGNAGNNVLTGTSQADTLIGNAGNDTLNGGDGNDILDGGTGNDILKGGAGNDTFDFGLGDGRDLIQDSSGSADQVSFDGGINPLDLVISRQANDLRVAIHGTSDQITVQNWYVGTTNRSRRRFKRAMENRCRARKWISSFKPWRNSRQIPE